MELSRTFQTRAQALEIYRLQLCKQLLFVEVFEAVRSDTPVQLTLRINETKAVITLAAKAMKMLRKSEAAELGYGTRAGVLLDVPITPDIVAPLREFFLATTDAGQSSAPFVQPSPGSRVRRSSSEITPPQSQAPKPPFSRGDRTPSPAYAHEGSQPTARSSVPSRFGIVSPKSGDISAQPPLTGDMETDHAAVSQSSNLDMTPPPRQIPLERLGTISGESRRMGTSSIPFVSQPSTSYPHEHVSARPTMDMTPVPRPSAVERLGEIPGEARRRGASSAPFMPQSVTPLQAECVAKRPTRDVTPVPRPSAVERFGEIPGESRRRGASSAPFVSQSVTPFKPERFSPTTDEADVPQGIDFDRYGSAEIGRTAVLDEPPAPKSVTTFQREKTLNSLEIEFDDNFALPDPDADIGTMPSGPETHEPAKDRLALDDMFDPNDFDFSEEEIGLVEVQPLKLGDKNAPQAMDGFIFEDDIDIDDIHDVEVSDDFTFSSEEDDMIVLGQPDALQDATPAKPMQMTAVLAGEGFDAPCPPRNYVRAPKMSAAPVTERSAMRRPPEARDLSREKTGRTSNRSPLGDIKNMSDEHVVRLLDRLESTAEKGSIFALFNLGPTASPEDIRLVYHDVVRSLHPDSYDTSRFSDKTVRRLEEAYQCFNEAIQMIQHPIRRKLYAEASRLEGCVGGMSLRQYKKWVETYRQKNVGNIRMAASLVEQIREDVAAGRLDDAATKLTLALQYDPFSFEAHVIQSDLSDNGMR